MYNCRKFVKLQKRSFGISPSNIFLFKNLQKINKEKFNCYDLLTIFSNLLILKVLKELARKKNYLSNFFTFFNIIIIDN